jgi:uroporphyrinogen III methyltransferase/synthase
MGEPSKVYLVGAGPGDPDLITVRGAQLCQTCDALVYDSLVPPELVSSSPAAQKIYVGKTDGGHAMTQEEITGLLVDLATRPEGPRRIVRLKGGDPYVFGRGGEEALACQRAGVPFEVVPGVTAGVAAPAYAGVPVTHRLISRGVIFFTGHLAKGDVDHLPWEHLARSGFTLVSYMGVKTVGIITQRLMEAGLSPATPAMMVQEGTTPGQRSVFGTVENIAALAHQADIRPPAVTVMGEVVSLGAELGPQQPRPLAGKTVVLLKAEESSYDELTPLRLAGARVVEVPIVRCVAGAEQRDARAMVATLGLDDVVLFRSSAAARFFGQAWLAVNPGPQPRLIAGSSTVRDTLRGFDFDVFFTEEHMVGAADILRAAGVDPGRPIWLPRSKSAGDRTVRVLQDQGYDPRPVPLYDTRPVPVPRDVRSLLSTGRTDAVLFLSGSCVEAAVAAAPGLVDLPPDRILFGAVGPLTAAVAERIGIHCDVIPDRPRVGDLVDALMARMALSERSIPAR